MPAFRESKLIKTMLKSLENSLQWHRNFIQIVRTPSTPGNLDELQQAMRFYANNVSAWPSPTKNIVVTPFSQTDVGLFSAEGEKCVFLNPFYSRLPSKTF